MDTLPVDLLKVIDQYLDAKRSALIGISTGLELFLSDYDEFSLEQWKWMAYVWSCYKNQTFEDYICEYEILKYINSKTIMFMKEYSSLFKYRQKKALDHKLVKEHNARDVIRRYKDKQEYQESNILELQYYIKFCIVHDCFELVQILTNYLINVFGIDYADEFYPSTGDVQQHAITRLLIDAYQLKNQKCIEYFESLLTRINTNKADRLMLLIGLLSGADQLAQYDAKAKPLLLELKGDMDFTDIILHEVLTYGYEKGVDLILETIEGSSIQDKLKAICQYVHDVGLYTEPLSVFFASAVAGKNMKIIKEIIALAGDDNDQLYNLAFEAYSQDNYEVFNMILELSATLRTVFQIKVNNIGNGQPQPLYEEDKITRRLFIRDGEGFDYIISTFSCQFDLDYVQEHAYRQLNFRLFKRVVDFKMN